MTTVKEVLLNENIDNIRKIKNDLWEAVQSANKELSISKNNFYISVRALTMKTLEQSVQKVDMFAEPTFVFTVNHDNSDSRWPILVHAFYLSDYKKELEKVFVFTAIRTGTLLKESSVYLTKE